MKRAYFNNPPRVPSSRGRDMVQCSRCGTDNPDEAVYCTNCGALLEKREPPARRREEADYLGALSAGVILIVLAVAYLRYPISVSLIVDYFRSLEIQQGFVKPPSALLNPVIFFFNLVGVWSILLAGLRLVFQRNARKAIGDLAGGLFSFFIAFLLTNYANDVIRGQAALAYFIVGIGLLIIVNAIVSFVRMDLRQGWR